MATRKATSRKAVCGTAKDIRPPLNGIPDRLRQIRTLIEAARIANDRELSPAILTAAKELIVDAQRTLAGGAA